ncbi:uncharacterized protein [Panulirus ornatus]|uniref:uncharacterized protein isoform X2 n=1 Tax=Panulirus ornatus TaxID=150431 RepID=UPI003A880623
MTGWLAVSPHKNPRSLRDLALSQVTSAHTSALTMSRHTTFPQELINTCATLKTMLPLELRTLVVEEVLSAVHSVHDPLLLTRLLLLHFQTDVQHLNIVTDFSMVPWLHLGYDHCTSLLQELGSTSKFSLQSLHLEGVTMVSGVLAEIIHRSPNLTSLHVSGDDAASEVLSYIKKNPRGLHSLHLDNCSVRDLDVLHSLIKSYKDVDPWVDTRGAGDENLDSSCPPLRHLSIQSPLVTLGGALVLLHSLRNLRSLQYSHWNSSICNLLLYLQHMSSNAAPFSLTSMSLWEATARALDALILCPRLQHLMMECTDPSLTSVSTLTRLSCLTSLTLRLVPEHLIVAAVEVVSSKLLVLEIEFEEYTRTPISWDTVEALQRHCPCLQRLEMRHLNIASNPGNFFITSRQRSSFTELTHLNLSGVVIEPALLARIMSNNVALESLVLDVNQNALTDVVLATLIKNNELDFLTHVYLSGGLLSVQSLTSLLTLPTLVRLSVHLPCFPFILTPAFHCLQHQLRRGNYLCSLHNAAEED